MRRERIGMLIQRVLDEGPFSMRQLAKESGLSYDTLRAWATARRTPREDSLVQIAEVLERRRDVLDALARELREAAR